jgi:hypothetical protein
MLLALIWGVVWAVFLQSNSGRFLAARFTWLTVVIGIGGDLLIGLLVVPLEAWAMVTGIVALSSIGVIVRSLWNEQQDQRALHQMVNGDKDTHSQ